MKDYVGYHSSFRGNVLKSYSAYISYQVFPEATVQIVAFWIVKPSSFARGYRSFGVTYCLQLQS
jgi:hypothetical protein